VAPDHLQRRQREDAQVEGEALPLEVGAVETHFFFDRELVAAVDLGPSGDARPQPVHALGRPQGDQVVLVEERRARSDEAHVALEHAP
jgi:hypothetical protein